MGLFDLFIKKAQPIPNTIDKSMDMHLKEAEVDVVAIVKNSHVMYINEHLDRLFRNSSRGKFDGRVVKFNFKGMEDSSSIDIFVAFDDQDAFTMFTLNMGRGERFNYVSQALMTYFNEIGIASSIFAPNTQYATQQEYAYKLFKEDYGYYMINNGGNKIYKIDWDGVTEG
jgi:hypothetical protein